VGERNKGLAVTGYELRQGGDVAVTETQTWAGETAALKVKCEFCGGVVGHDGVCFRVKAIAYRRDGSIKLIEFQ
jgi:hypothetical protein